MLVKFKDPPFIITKEINSQMTCELAIKDLVLW